MAPIAISTEERLQRKLRIDGDCWIFTGSVNKRDGYGQFNIKRDDGRWVTARAHRVAYTLWIGPIPEGHEVHHRCQRVLCCNPVHLVPRTRDEHAAEHRRKFCRAGHPLCGDNLYTSPHGRRGCVECRRAAVRRYYHQQKERQP